MEPIDIRINDIEMGILSLIQKIIKDFFRIINYTENRIENRCEDCSCFISEDFGRRLFCGLTIQIYKIYSNMYGQYGFWPNNINIYSGCDLFKKKMK
jgi:hypothetical protein